MIYSAIGILAILIHLVINYDVVFKTKSRFRFTADKDYTIYLDTVLFYFITDALWGIFREKGMPALLYIDTFLYYVAAVFSVILWCKYAISYLELGNRTSKILRVICIMIFDVDIAVLLLNFFVPVFFGLDADGTYYGGPFRYVALAVQMLLFAGIACLSLAETLKIEGPKRRRYAMFCLFSVTMILGIIAQGIFPFLPFYTIGLLLGVCILHVFVAEDEMTDFRKKLIMNEKRLKENTDIIANAGFGIWKIRISEDGSNTMTANRKLQEILGIRGMCLDPEELYKFYHSRLHEDMGTIEKEDYKSMCNGELRSRIVEWDHPTKGSIFLHAGGSRFCLSDGETIISGYCEDITQRRQEEMHNKQMLDDNIAANKAKTVFLQNMSHEIRTPLNAMFGFAQLLGLPDGSWTEEEKEMYNRYVFNSYNMLDMLIGDIIDIADSEHGNYRIELDDVSVNSVCRNAMMSVEYRKSESVEMYLTTDVSDEYMIRSDGRRIQQVLINYLSNACKHTQEGEIHLHCSTSENPGKLTFSVTDTGEGVPEDKAEIIFNRFTKLNQFVQGSGLGLNICLMIARKLGGEALLDTSYKGGARFLFIIDPETFAN